MPALNTKVDFLLLYDLVVRDRKLISDIATNLEANGYSVDVAPLKDERAQVARKEYRVILINKPHFYSLDRFKKKILGQRYVVLDTEGVLPGENRQHVLFEPDGYLHWFTHQAERYDFQFCKTAVLG